MPERTRGRGTTAIKPATAGVAPLRLPRPGARCWSGDRRAGTHRVQRVEEDVVLLGGAHGDADALAGERPGDDGARLEGRGDPGGLLAEGQPDEVGLAVGDVEPALVQGRGEPLA